MEKIKATISRPNYVLSQLLVDLEKTSQLLVDLIPGIYQF